MNMKAFVDSLKVVLVLYNIYLDESESFQSLLKMDSNGGTISLFVYDNSKSPQTVKQHGGLNITYVHDPDNSGVSKAYNEGAAHARKQKKNWVLLLDQDTALPSTILQSYGRAIERNPEMKLFVPVLQLENGRIFSPCIYRFKRGFYLDDIAEGIHSLQRLSPVNSGMLIDVKAFFEVGGYNNDVKLDFSDFQFVERFRKQYPHFFVMDVKCLQDFSDHETALTNQAIRFVYYCEGARKIEKNGLWDWFSYSAVVFVRALRLGLRYKTLDFYRIYLSSFLFPKSEST